jgi:hypothetical protein
MITRRQLGKINDRLGQELGRNAIGEPRYSWRWSEDLKHQMRVPEKWDYVADPETGVISARPVYVSRRMAPHLKDQWVLCARVQPISEEEWHAKFGDLLPWAKAGYYFPLNVELPAGEDPDVDATACAIDLFRKQMRKTEKELTEEGEAREDKRVKDSENELDDRIKSACTAFGNLPGNRDGQVEFQIGRDALMATEDVFTEKETVH